MTGHDLLIEDLRRLLPRSGIMPATSAVIEHFDLLASGNACVGTSIYIQSQAAEHPDLGGLRRGRELRPGHRELFAHCELRCLRAGSEIVVVVVDQRGGELSRRLTCAASAAETYDEALFVWFGPQEYLCTPWHDGEPNRSVITVDALRAYAAAWTPPVR
jgi:hypothetical protein